MVFCSHAVEHPKCPVDNGHVRVHLYSSAMVIKPHKKFDDVRYLEIIKTRIKMDEGQTKTS
jgi:hypothetical protein